MKKEGGLNISSGNETTLFVVRGIISRLKLFTIILKYFHYVFTIVLQ